MILIRVFYTVRVFCESVCGTCANQLGFKTDKRYTFKKNCLFSPEEMSMIKAIRTLPRFSTVNGDEAIRVLYKQEWWRQTFINKFYRLCRQDNKITLLCMPRFSDFNEGFRNHRILLWIHLLDRGIGVAFMRDWNPFVNDPWHFKDNEKIIYKYGKRRKYFQMSIENQISLFKRSANFVDVIMFPDLVRDMRIEYKMLAAQEKYSGLQEEFEMGRHRSKRLDQYKARTSKAVQLLHKEMGWSQAKIVKRLGIPQQTVSRYIKETPITRP